MASAMAEVVEDSEDMLARLLGGAARLGKEREGQDQIALIPCRKVTDPVSVHNSGTTHHVESYQTNQFEEITILNQVSYKSKINIVEIESELLNLSN
ncbi:hypothetical protein GUJ93_ZPchr0011g27060 [Zizania palustris]|uniref:Uncharacterized protein n=1 Tax=Zizania palustris TaxID=103762 RepID=A0A8J6BMX3_ZIZPA|nr:hypothetical protein GUJ93_ZPchr0011g27060 [Zizania palustris]